MINKVRPEEANIEMLNLTEKDKKEIINEVADRRRGESTYNDIEEKLLSKFNYHHVWNSSEDIIDENPIKTSNFSINDIYQKLFKSKQISHKTEFEKNFGRVLELKVGEFNLLLGSNLLIFYKNV